jgi:hypothetical protein
MAVDNMNHVARSGPVREVRQELCGESGGSAPADALDLLAAVWTDFEREIMMMPATVIFEFGDRKGADPRWPLTGQGDRFTTIREAARAGSVEEHPDPAATP